MGQQEVYDFLKRRKARWFTAKEISAELQVSIGSITNCLKKLRKSRSLQYRSTGNRNQYEYKFKY
ncbi:TPA: hypothetical protein HA361_00510 [Candidatus Woesearchaeota archaeon]|nr:hypothetical protein [Candidatus Woesearchaeota archaeon]HII69379.1 hypothetical protein [Candidatus Woesearchaeota archaeon]